MAKRGGSSALAAMIKQRSEAGVFLADPDVHPTLGVVSKAPEVASPAPAPQYVPKTTSFSGANKCCICEKTVYKMEETIAVGRVWHNDCFTCGGSHDNGCKRVLKRDGYVDHESQPYCNACYNKNFKPKGFGIGTGLNTDFGGHSSSSHHLESVKEEAVTAPAPPAPAPAPSAPVAHAGPPAAFEKPAPPVVHKAAPATPPPAPPAVKSAEKYTPTNRVGVTDSAPKCTACAKTVYKMEEMIAVGRVWHAACFTCGGTSKTENGCKRTLKRDGYVDHDNQPYCNACYNKNFKPKGFGIGTGLNTDYGPAHETATQQVTAGVSKMMSTPEPAAPPAAKPPSPAVPPAPAAPAAQPAAPAAPARRPSQPQQPPINTAPSNETNEKFHQAAILQANVPNRKASIAIGSSTAATKGDVLHKESGYVGDNDEVDESEW